MKRTGMNTTTRRSKATRKTRKPPFRRAFVPVMALAKAVEFDQTMMWVRFTDGRVLGVPLVWFPTLLDATPEQRARCEIGGGIGLHWRVLDEDLSIAGLMAGVDWRAA